MVYAIRIALSGFQNPLPEEHTLGISGPKRMEKHLENT